MAATGLLCMLTVVSPYQAPVNAARLLFVPFLLKSIARQFETIVSDLKGKGHKISIFLPLSYPELKSLKAANLYDEILLLPTGSQLEANTSTYDNIPLGRKLRTGITPNFLSFCTKVLEDDNLYNALRERQFNLGLVHATPQYRCLMVLWQKLAMRFVAFQGFSEPWLSRNPGLPSAVPLVFGQGYTEQMSFQEKVWNVICFLEWSALPDIEPFSQDFVQRYLPGENRSIYQMSMNAAMAGGYRCCD